MTPLAALEQALGYAKFKNNDVKDATIDLLKALQRDFVEAATYEPSSETEAATRNLETVMNEVDESSSDENEEEEDV